MSLSFFRVLLLSATLTLIAAAQAKPSIKVAPTRVKNSEIVMLTGTGFTPNRFAMSHLRRPDESEYNPLRFRIDERGEFSHKIDTTMLDPGTFEVWVEDETTKVLTERVRFTVD